MLIDGTNPISIDSTGLLDRLSLPVGFVIADVCVSSNLRLLGGVGALCMRVARVLACITTSL